MDFSTILQSPDIRAIVQTHGLEREFHDGLYPRSMFRGEAIPVLWPANVGDSMVFTGVGMMDTTMEPIQPGKDPEPVDYQKEQWSAQLQQYTGRVPDTHMPTSITAIASLFYRNIQQLGLQAALTLNRVVRNRLFNAAMSGWTVADGAQGATRSLRVKRLNGFTRARNPNLPAGSPVLFDTVTASNPLAITVRDTSGSPADLVVNVTAYTPDIAGDETGPGVLTLDADVTVVDRAYVFSSDATSIVRATAGNSIDALGSTSTFSPDLIRAGVARLENTNVPKMPDGRYHMHLDPVSMQQIFGTHEWQRLLTSLPDYYYYREFTAGEILGTVALKNTECPQAFNVKLKSDGSYDKSDKFGGEIVNAGKYGVHRALIMGQEAIFEYYQDAGQLITEAGVQGRVGDFSQLTNNGIEVNVDRVQLVMRSPQNVLQDMVSAAWKAIMDWPVRTDATTGDAARFKRVVCIEHTG